jgi:DNA-binding CsgD family transcriptional regulator
MVALDTDPRDGGDTGGRSRVLVFTRDRPTGAALVRALQGASFDVEWVGSDGELRARAARFDLPPPALVFVSPAVGPAPEPADRDNYLEGAVSAYAALRQLSARQRQILTLYLRGKGDKEIADVCGCGEATVYEHWRRMARKASGHHKGDAISDFHAFLAARGENDAVP